MKKILIRGVLGLVTIIGVGLLIVFVASERKIRATYDVPVVAIQTSSDSATLARGEHVAVTRGCVDCHGEDLGGTHFFDALPVASITATNLTSGANGVGSFYTDEDFVRAIRSGVRPDGSTLLIMPSHEYRPLGPEDLGALVSWIKSVPPVDTEPVNQTVGPVGRALYLAGQVPLVPAELIDHEDATFEQPAMAATAEYGAYLATACIGCHGEDYSGGPMTGAPPDWPTPANLTPHETGLASWTKEDFEHFAETGVAPDGRQRDPLYMPWQALQVMSEVERDAVWTFLRSLPPTPKPE